MDQILITSNPSYFQHQSISVGSSSNAQKEGLFETIQRNKTHYQKRAYQCIKLLGKDTFSPIIFRANLKKVFSFPVNLFNQCELAKEIMESSPELRKKWTWSVEWLHEELDKGIRTLNSSKV